MTDDTFAGLEEETLAALRAVGQVKSYSAGDVVCHQGVVEHTFYLILDGRVKVVQRLEDGTERTLETRGKDDYFGEMGLLDAKPRMADVTTLTPATLLEIAPRETTPWLPTGVIEGVTIRVVLGFALLITKHCIGFSDFLVLVFITSLFVWVVLRSELSECFFDFIP